MDIAAEYDVLESVNVSGKANEFDELSREVETVEMWSYLMLAVGMLALTVLGVLRAPYGAFSRVPMESAPRPNAGPITEMPPPIGNQPGRSVGVCPVQLVEACSKLLTPASKWGPSFNARAAWMLQECPSAILPVAIIWSGGDALMMEMDIKAKLLGAAFLAHYVHRAFLFPLALQPSGRTPVIVSLLAFVFTSCNALLQASMWLQHQHWRRVRLLQFLIGMTVWVVGACTNIHSDYHLIHLKRTASKSSKARWPIPYRGMFQYVSGGPYCAEILEWLGYGIAANHIAAFAFWGFVICNIGPRAMHYHNMYLQLYPDYPKHRKALIPGVI